MTLEDVKLLQTEPKKFLSRSFEVEARIKFLKKRLATWEERAASLTVTLTDEPKGSGRGAEWSEFILAEIIDIKADINKELVALSEIEKQIECAIKAFVSDRWARAVLERRYLLLESWSRIAKELGFSERWIYQLHGKALAEIRKQAIVVKP